MKMIKIFLPMLFLIFAVVTNGQQDTTKNTKTARQKNEQVKQNQVRHGRFFVDKNGDGFNDNAPDHDGDGIPNGLDPDYKKLMNKLRNKNLPYIDLNGDGINDHLQKNGKSKGMMKNQNQLEPQSSDQQHGQAGHGKNNQHGKGNKKGKK